MVVVGMSLMNQILIGIRKVKRADDPVTLKGTTQNAIKYKVFI
jgi:hypothetical protein